MMRQGRRHLVWLVLGLWFIVACRPDVPPEIIQPDDMEDILYDYHLSQGMATQGGIASDYKRNLYFETVLKKHDVTQAQFDSSLVYYYTRADRFIDIYKHLQKRLGDEALVWGASAGEVERYSQVSLTGDTADVWEGPRRAMLIPQRPFHLLQFTQKADSSYHAGDGFLLTFNTATIAQSGRQQTSVYLAITYENDSTVTQNTVVMASGTTSLRVGACKERVKNIRGFILMGMRLEEKPQNDVCIMFLDRIRLIRFHQKVEEEETPTTAPSDTISAMKADTTMVDSGKPRVRRLGERPTQNKTN